eukprot:sb/3466597/
MPGIIFLSQSHDDKSNTSSAIIERGKKIVEARMNNLRDSCARRNYPNFNTCNMYAMPKAHVTWMPVFKAGSTTWKKFFIDLELSPDHVEPKKDPYHLNYLEVFRIQCTDIERKKGNQKKKRFFKTEPSENIRFTVVRHPMARLVSHYYRTKNNPIEVYNQWDGWVGEAITKPRSEIYHLTKEQKKQFLAEAIEYCEALRHNRPFERSEENPFLNPPHPTFSEFIDFILQHGKLKNGHWAPAATWTDACQNDIDYVVQLENDAVEAPYILKQLKLSNHTELYKSKANTSGANSKSASETDIKRLLGELTLAQRTALNNFYALDYELFGYEAINV